MPKVSVCIITYNHAKYLAQALDSVLAQQTDFDFEILVGEDESNDGTREILRDYEARHPGRIQAFYRSRAENIAIGGRATGRRNLVSTIQSAKGSYIALLEGDDYWTDPGKLQAQADFLDSHAQCSSCFHDVTVMVEATGEMRPFPMKSRAELHPLRDVLVGDTHIPTLSLMYRRGLFGDFPQWYFTLRMGDLPLNILNSRHGPIGFIDRDMGVYRVHRGGIWSSGAHFHARSSQQVAGENLALLEFYEAMRGWLDAEYQPIVREQLAKCAYALVWHHQASGELDLMRKYLRTALAAHPFPATIDRKFILKAIALTNIPGAYHWWWKRRQRSEAPASA